MTRSSSKLVAKKFLRWLGRLPARVRARSPRADYWFWPLLEVSYITFFSFLPLLIFAFNEHITSKTSLSFNSSLSNLLLGGQLMFYAIGFLATASWLLIHEIRWPRAIKPIFLLLIFGATIIFSITVGVDPTAATLNKEAFRAASYWTFGVSLLLYAVCEVLKAVQPLLQPEAQFARDADQFSEEFGAEMRGGQ